jgi:SpoVK/Ycf46/Vps4 family AAA+-type ATPase
VPQKSVRLSGWGVGESGVLVYISAKDRLRLCAEEARVARRRLVFFTEEASVAETTNSKTTTTTTTTTRKEVSAWLFLGLR